jgi:VWFA-related protein
MLKRVLCVCLLGFSSATGVAFAQDVPPAGPTAPTLTVTTRIVVLDVVVTQRKGHAVVDSGLTRDDFTVLEDGKPQQIRSFEAPEEHRMPQGAEAVVVHSAADLGKIGDAPVTVLVLDELNSRFEDASYSRQMTVEFLKKQPEILKQPTALMVAANSSFKQLHDYTQSRDELIAAIKKHSPELPTKLMGSGRTGAVAVERMAQVLAALQQIAQSATGTPGRKNLIWIGNGFPTADLVGLDQKQADLIETAIRRCTTRLLAARVTVYTIDPTANSSSSVEANDPADIDSSSTDTGADPFGSSKVSFNNLAPATGGISFQGRNDIENIIGEGIAKGQNYYTISYTPTSNSEAAAKFRNIRIVMKNPQLQATTREGYYPDSAADLNPVVDKDMSEKQVRANLQLDLSQALTSTIVYNGLSVLAIKAGEGIYAIHVADAGMGWQDDADGGQHTEATVAAGWYDAKGKLVGRVIREETAKRGAGNRGANFNLPITLPAGVARLRVVVRDAANGHMGTVDLTSF